MNPVPLLLLAITLPLLLGGCGKKESVADVKSVEASQTPGTFMYGWMKETFEEYAVDAEKGILNAQQNLVWHYENGEGVPRDYVAAYAWKIVSAEKAEIAFFRGKSRDRLKRSWGPD